MFYAISIIISFCFALSSPQLIKKSVREQNRFELGGDAANALKKWNPEFKPFVILDYPATVFNLFKEEIAELPMAVSGDFNGDGKTDWAVMGHDKKNEHVVILLIDTDKFQVVPVQSKTFISPSSQIMYNEFNEEERGLTSYLGLVRSRDLKFKDADKSTRGNLDALEYETYGAASRVIYLKKKDKSNYEVKDYNGRVD